MLLYEISPKSSLDPDPAWWVEYRRMLPCGACELTVPQELRRAGVPIRLRAAPGPFPISKVTPPGILVARRDFVDLFAEEIGRYLKQGPVFGRDGGPLLDLRSLVSEKPLLIRGGPKPIRYVCPICGRLRYRATGKESDRYVMKHDLTGQPIYEAKGWGLVVTSELRARIERGRWKGIWICELSVREEPLDGLGPTIPNLSY